MKNKSLITGMLLSAFVFLFIGSTHSQSESVTTWVDDETGVEYLVFQNARGGIAATPRYLPNGQLSKSSPLSGRIHNR